MALIDQAMVIARILAHLGLPTEMPEARAARSPPADIDRHGNSTHEGADFDFA